MVSALTGRWPARPSAGPGVLGAARARAGPVRRRGHRAARGGRHRTFIEVGPGRRCCPASGPQDRRDRGATARRCRALRRGRRRAGRRLLAAAGRGARARRVPVRTGRRCCGGGRRGGPADVRVPAPAVLAGGRGRAATRPGWGWRAAGHPLLGAAVELAGTGRAGADRAAVAGGAAVAGRPRGGRAGAGARDGVRGARGPGRGRGRVRAGRGAGDRGAAGAARPAAGSRSRSWSGPRTSRPPRRSRSIARAGPDGPWTRHAAGTLGPAGRRPGRGGAGGVAAARRGPGEPGGLLPGAGAGRARLRAGVPRADGGLAARQRAVRRGDAPRGHPGRPGSRSTRRCWTPRCTCWPPGTRRRAGPGPLRVGRGQPSTPPGRWPPGPGSPRPARSVGDAGRPPAATGDRHRGVAGPAAAAAARRPPRPRTGCSGRTGCPPSPVPGAAGRGVRRCGGTAAGRARRGRYAGLAALAAAAPAGEPVPATVAAVRRSPWRGPGAAAAGAGCGRRRAWRWCGLARGRAGPGRARGWWSVTERAVNAGPEARSRSPPRPSGAWCGPRPSENPGRLMLADADDLAAAGDAGAPGPGWASRSSRCAAASCGCRGWPGPAPGLPVPGGAAAWRLAVTAARHPGEPGLDRGRRAVAAARRRARSGSRSGRRG